MAGRGAAPKQQAQRRNHHDPQRGEWRNAPGIGWQHGDVPSLPDGVKAETTDAWSTWMGAWYAAFWSPEDLPALRAMALLYDQVMRGEYQRHAELRLNLDTWGVTPKGQQDRRWAPPIEAEPAKPQRTQRERARLKAVK